VPQPSSATSPAHTESQAVSQQNGSFAHTHASMVELAAHLGLEVTAQQGATHWKTPGLQEGFFGSLQSPSALQLGPHTLHPSASTSPTHSADHCSWQHCGAWTQTQLLICGLAQPGTSGVASQQSPCLTQTFLVTSQAGFAGSEQ
jgi:hypothetical protein